MKADIIRYKGNWRDQFYPFFINSKRYKKTFTDLWCCDKCNFVKFLFLKNKPDKLKNHLGNSSEVFAVMKKCGIEIDFFIHRMYAIMKIYFKQVMTP